jgi:hypothetical protein
LSLVDESRVKVLARNARTFVDNGDVVVDRVASALQPNDRVLLGTGDAAWAPADEFTEAVVNSVRSSHPELVTRAREWREALIRFVRARRLTEAQLRSRLADVGIGRELQTLSGWLDMSRSSPIAPRNPRIELTRLWPLISEFSGEPLELMIEACSRLRTLRNEAAKSLVRLLKGDSILLDVDEALSRRLVDNLRKTIHVHEVDGVVFGTVPPEMIGWWISRALAHSCRSTAENKNAN